VKLLFDENLPVSLVARFSGSSHVRLIGMERASDLEIWEHAKRSGYAIVTKDSDFHHLSFVYGAPPRVVWLRIGNCSVADLVEVLTKHEERMRDFLDGQIDALLVIDA
jgi:predicted nuclease of predicted toxin-antitoxin system